MDGARTLRVAVCLHRLDITIPGDKMASKTLEASQHHLGPLLGSFLTSSMSNLTFREVVDCVLQENQCASEHSINYLLAHHARTHQELDNLTKAHRESNKSNKASQKKIRRRLT